MQFTKALIESLAPDLDALKRGEQLAKTSNWSGCGRSERALWGLCKGSGSQPYTVCIDLVGPAYKCSCPSKQFPCKHTIGLMSLSVNNLEHFTETSAPNWAMAWLDKRKLSAEAKSSNETADKASDTPTATPEGPSKSRVERLALMATGIEELEQWLFDLMRQGLGNTSQLSDEAWARAAARMIDAKLPGPANAIKEMALHISEPEHGLDQALAIAGQLYMMVRAFKNREQLSPALQDELLSVLGVTVQKKNVIEQEPAILDTWTVLAVLEGADINNINFRRVWFQGQDTQRFGMFLDFAFGRVGYTEHWSAGTSFKAKLAFYPGAYAQRATLVELLETLPQAQAVHGLHDIEGMMAAYAAALGQSPWIKFMPVILDQVVPVIQAETLLLVDPNSQALACICDDESAWRMVASACGQALRVFGEWDGQYFRPLSLFLPQSDTLIKLVVYA